MARVVNEFSIETLSDELFEAVAHQSLGLFSLDDRRRRFSFQRVVVGTDRLDVARRQFSALHAAAITALNLLLIYSLGAKYANPQMQQRDAEVTHGILWSIEY